MSDTCFRRWFNRHTSCGKDIPLPGEGEKVSTTLVPKRVTCKICESSDEYRSGVGEEAEVERIVALVDAGPPKQTETSESKPENETEVSSDPVPSKPVPVSVERIGGDDPDKKKGRGRPKLPDSETFEFEGSTFVVERAEGGWSMTVDGSIMDGDPWKSRKKLVEFIPHWNAKG